MPYRTREWGSDMENPYETLDALKQIRTKLDEARKLSQILGTPEEPYNLEVSLDAMIMGIDAQIGALENAGNSDTV